MIDENGDCIDNTTNVVYKVFQNVWTSKNNMRAFEIILYLTFSDMYRFYRSYSALFY
ncbi:hypothetical protein MtrunA17_Chr6g0481881 [Medicago truncatula]|uniref:Uncharacterized protein n=1 Tax=Medicago truncatula TaxID=3880 RepID=G7KKC5_MEDTR|nr:hypothetical protein MTR_6g077940 [Medicago truncatula]RHN52560.1 hypothetical protein MtrunA17_Chr6g0481881 [Medicago truncatula]